MNIDHGSCLNLGRRKSQQDSFGFSVVEDMEFRRHGGVLAVVADGMGGLAAGDQASRLATKVFLDAYMAKAPQERIPDALTRALARTNEAVCALAAQLGQEDNCGTTLIAVALHEGLLHWIAVGDSHIYLARRGEIRQLNTDHNYYQHLRAEVAAGRMSRDEAARRASGENVRALTSFVGLRDLRLVDRSHRPTALEPGDRVLLCSDGLDGGLSPSEMAGLLRQPARAAAEALVSAVLMKDIRGQDNVTAVVLACEGDGGRPALQRPPTRPSSESRQWSGPPAADEGVRRPHPPRPRSGRKPLILGLALLTLLALLGGTLYLGWRALHRETTPVPTPPPAPMPKPPPREAPEPQLERAVKNTIGMDFVLIEAGEFRMGCDSGADPDCPRDAGPSHRVTITKPFYMAQFEVTNTQWTQVMGKKAGSKPNDKKPVVKVSWNEARQFIERLNELEKTKRYRLPTEAEWEYAARAGSGSDQTWFFGNDPALLPDHALCHAESGPLEVGGARRPNDWNLFDMYGNAREWVADLYAEYYDSRPAVDPQGPTQGDRRVVRGGSWRDDAKACSSAARANLAPNTQDELTGFRLVMEAETPPEPTNGDTATTADPPDGTTEPRAKAAPEADPKPENGGTTVKPEPTNGDRAATQDPGEQAEPSPPPKKRGPRWPFGGGSDGKKK